MPVPVTKYTCQFKCGHRATGEISRMKGHESLCWNNPDNKTCKTCSNEVYITDGDDYRQWIDRDCKIPELSDLLTDINDDLKGHNSMHIRPIQQCPYWNKSDSDDKVHLFIDKIKGEIDLSRHNAPDKRFHFPYFDVRIEDREVKEYEDLFVNPSPTSPINK